ncbi:hypothetical protein G736_05364 [Escherichia coli HVH 70 (4-2963531)]|nr:hypothetical protein G736_05364 [Escherichia coli HVH 70 (4-2963531)]
MATMDSKYIQHLRKISAVLLRLISRTLKLFPFGLVMVPLYYFILHLTVFSLKLFMNGRRQIYQNK